MQQIVLSSAAESWGGGGGVQKLMGAWVLILLKNQFQAEHILRGSKFNVC